MLETMLALKNNDMRKIPGYDPEPMEKLRKLQRALVRHFHFLFRVPMSACARCDSTESIWCCKMPYLLNKMSWRDAGVTVSL